MTNDETQRDATVARPATRLDRVLQFVFGSTLELLALYVGLTSVSGFVPGERLAAVAWGFGIGLVVAIACVVHERRRERSTRPIAVWALPVAAIGSLLHAERLLSFLWR